MSDPRSTRVAFIGTGVMGSSMAGHLMDAGYPITVYNRTYSKAEPLLARGAVWADSAGDAAEGADVVITIVGYPSDVEQVYLAPGGVIERARTGALCIDMTTSSPELAKRIFEAGAARGIRVLDAPVSGGDIGARNATLTIMVGGGEEDFAEAEPLLRTLGRSVVHQGSAGAGQHAKLANQVAIAGSMLATVEMLAYARAAGLDRERVLESVRAGSAASWSLENLAPRILREDYAPGFFVKHFVKDLRLALEESGRTDTSLPGLTLAKRLYELLQDEGGAELGTQALWLLYADTAERTSHGVDGGATTNRLTGAAE